MRDLTYHDFLATFGIGGAHPGGIALTREVVAKEVLTRKSRVLDAGCGTGQTAAYLAKVFGCQVTALDLHPLMLEKAGRRFQREHLHVQLVRGDVHELPFASGSFDLVLVESVTIFTTINKALGEYARVLKPGGVLLDLEMTAERPLSARELEELRSVYNTRQVPTEAEWTGRLQGAGFADVSVLHGGTVASAIPGQEVSEQELPEFDPSQQVDPRLYEIWRGHQELTERYSRRLGYRVYRAVHQR
ncbi:class I SAM-dependent methyltransferase [Tumebacillus permanentifrigoris]|uniref:Methyltransferase family protein n=1 Tax=Tumebacillus permanentifrigoris TaxID=378543 RepID=A0A316D884_9BACL|nr:class I SAM-dependent methyltransferase [Tumebacillus permanentifrigoris]PWK11479.1 methyltransferase family protein [Tumebacillus permanentifrigoris]